MTILIDKFISNVFLHLDNIILLIMDNKSLNKQSQIRYIEIIKEKYYWCYNLFYIEKWWHLYIINLMFFITF